jgi:hypothetical protein
MAVLLDYSGVILLAGLWLVGLSVETHRGSRPRNAGDGPGLRDANVAYALGAIGPLLLLWLYQWRSFGHPLYPPQHWMPPVEFIGEGYRGVAWPRLDLARLLAFDHRFGLFASCPLFLLALVAPIVNGRARRGSNVVLERTDLLACVGIAVAFFLFFSGVHYTRWQFNTGIRYLAPAFPFLFILTSVVLLRLPGWVARVVGVGSIAFAWSMAMVRDVSGGKVELSDPDTGLGVLDPLISVLTSGPQLPVLTTLSRMEAYGALSSGAIHPLLVLALLGGLLWVVWRARPG